MSEFSYDLNVTMDPPQAPPGATVTITARFSNVTGEIKTVYGVVSAYGYSEVLPKTGENTYSLNLTVPYEAPPGTYDISFFARDTSGNKGKSVVIPFRVT